MRQGRTGMHTNYLYLQDCKYEYKIYQCDILDDTNIRSIHVGSGKTLLFSNKDETISALGNTFHNNKKSNDK